MDGKVSSFFEKPQTSKDLINGGYFVADQKLFDYLIDEPTLIFEREPMDELSKNGHLVVTSILVSGNLWIHFKNIWR